MIDSDKVFTIEPHLALFDAYKSIDSAEMKHKYVYASSNEAFDAACSAIKELLKKAGYKEVDGEFVK